MGLEFYNLETGENLFIIIDNEISNFDTYFNVFNKKYNDLIDIYGDFRLHKNHLEFLKELISNTVSMELVGFRDMIDMCIQADITITVNGD